LLSDLNKRLIKLYGILQNLWVALDYKGVAKRSVFLVDGRGVLCYKWVTDVPTDEPYMWRYPGLHGECLARPFVEWHNGITDLSERPT
jgi:hypothetical protein